MNGDPQQEQEKPQTPATPDKEDKDKPTDGDKAAKDGACGTGAAA